MNPTTPTPNDKVPVAEETIAPRSASERPRRSLWWLDLVLFLALCGLALPVRFAATRGDLWLDEADYALAGSRGVQANRLDAFDDPNFPDGLIRLRHFHAPLTAQVISLALRRDWTDPTLRFPFVLAGGLTVGLVYLCGLALFDRRREIAIGCALLVIVTPADIRMASHALPWSFIILELMLLLWTLIQYLRTRHAG